MFYLIFMLVTNLNVYKIFKLKFYGFEILINASGTFKNLNPYGLKSLIKNIWIFIQIIVSS